VGRFRLVASDLDGTLLRSDGTFSARTLRAIHAVRDAGVEVALVTARAPRWIREIVQQLDLESGYAVCSNGAIVFDYKRNVPMLHRSLPASVATRIIEALRLAAPGVAFACERESLSFREPHYVPLWPTPGMQGPDGDALQFASEAVTKLVVQHPQLSQTELHELVAGVCGEEATATISGEVLVEISAAGVTKAYALSALCDEIGIRPEQVIAFGDMPNDIPMLEWAGLGIAVENAHPDVVAIADQVTATNDNDGVALSLEQLVLANCEPRGQN
jgi:Cof subfamily protein (haloacid dehalogenase superfamily)